MYRISTAQVWVDDQDEALAFYTKKLGMEVRSDVTLPEMGNFRWLTVGPAGQPDIAIVLMAIPGPPVMDSETADQVRALMAKGFAGTIFLETDDIQASYEQLKARGLEFSEEPEERPYGIDSAFRDPSGNSIRLTQVTMAGVVSEHTLGPDPIALRLWGLAPVSRLIAVWRSPPDRWPGSPRSRHRGGSAPARGRAGRP